MQAGAIEEMIESTWTRHRGRMKALGNGGFTLVELLLVMALSLFVLMAATQVLISMTTQFKQQTRIAQKSIETGFGLDMLKKDITLAGYAVPTGRKSSSGAKITYDEINWKIFEANTSYEELTSADDYYSMYNAPLIMEAGIPNSTVNGSSRLVIRSAAVGDDPGAGKFVLFVEGNIEDGSADTGVKLPPEFNSAKDRWDLGYDPPQGDTKRKPNIGANDLVIVINTRDEDNLGLVFDPDEGNPTPIPKYYTTFNATDNFRSVDKSSIHIIYSISSQSTGLCAPFNRVDYYVSDKDVPSKCAPGTGVLYRSQMIHGKPGDPCTMGAGVKIMECVAFMRVFFELDSDGDGYVDTVPPPEELNHNNYIAKDFRDPLKQVDVFILTHDGTLDPNYTYTGNGAADGNITIVDYIGSEVFNTKFDVKTMIDVAAASTSLGVARTIQGEHEWKRYRWRTLKLTAQPTAKGMEK